MARWRHNATTSLASWRWSATAAAKHRLHSLWAENPSTCRCAASNSAANTRSFRTPSLARPSALSLMAFGHMSGAFKAAASASISVRFVGRTPTSESAHRMLPMSRAPMAAI